MFQAWLKVGFTTLVRSACRFNAFFLLAPKNIDLVIKVEKAYQDLNDYKELVLKRAQDGSITKLKDIARVEFGALNTNTLFKGNGKQTVGIGIYQQSTANTIEVALKIKTKIKELEPTLPAGSTLSVSFDRSNYIEAAIYEVYKTIFIAIILVIIIIYLFLGNLTGVIIPAVTIPVGIISTFLAIYVAGFSLNLFTLMAIVLAIGIVVDDAIVMGENISRRMEMGELRLVAAYRGSSASSLPSLSFDNTDVRRDSTCWTRLPSPATTRARTRA